MDARNPRLDARTKKDVEIYSTDKDDNDDKSTDKSNSAKEQTETKKNSRTKRQLKRPINPLASAESVSIICYPIDFNNTSLLQCDILTRSVNFLTESL